LKFIKMIYKTNEVKTIKHETLQKTKIDVDRFYNAVEDWIMLLAKERAYRRERADREAKNKPPDNVELTVNFVSENPNQPISDTERTKRTNFTYQKMVFENELCSKAAITYYTSPN